MQKLIIRLFFILASAAFANVYGQNITFNHLTTDDGLSQFSVNSLYVDENGILWIGTREGLNRYNGDDIQTYKLQKNNPNSLFCNTVSRITGNHNGKIYLLCTEGVAEFNLATQKFTTLIQGNINSIYYNDGLFIGKKNEIYRYNEETGNFDLYYQLPDRNLEIVCIHINKDVLWLGTTTNGVYCLNIDKKELTHPIQKGNITSFYQDSESELWIGSWEEGLFRVKADGTISTISTDNSKLDTTAPEIMGLEYKAETKLAYAEYFKMYHYDEGITLLEIDMTKDTERDPEKQNEDDKKAEDTDTAAAEDTAAATDEEEAAAASDSKKTSTEKAKDLTEKTKELYEGNVVKYLIVPKDVEIPAGLDKDMIVIQLPVEKTYVASEDALKLLDEQLDAAESIKAVGMEQKDCQIENIAKAMEDKKISFDGAFDDLDYKALVKDEIDFAILPSEFLPGNAKDEEDADAADETADTKAEDQKDDKDDKTTDEKADEDKTPEELLKEENERLSDTAERLATLTIPMLVDRSADEKTDLAKAEWLKVYGVIFGCEDQANELFQQMVKAEENK